jgi:hypothetical protein
MRFVTSIAVLATSVLAGSYGSDSTDCDKVSYALFEGPVCGIIVFKEDSNGNVIVETVGKGLSGLDPSIGPFPYHGTPPNAHLTDSPCQSCSH